MNHSSPTVTVIKGLVATVIGAMLIIVSYRVILDMLIFIGGLLLLRTGLRLLNSSEFERIIGGVKAFFRHLIS